MKEARFNLNVWRSQEQHDASRVVRQGKDSSLMGSSFKNCEVPAARELCRLLHHTAWSLLCFRHVYMSTPSKFSIDTKHDVLKICISFSNMAILGMYVKFRGVSISLGIDTTG